MTLRAALAAAISAAAAWLSTAATSLAASPGPSAAVGGDPRSAGQGPGLVGDPAFAIIAVVAIGLGAVVVTLAWVRLTAPRRG
ncbi:MAG TPA: hypothetical protein VIU37_12145 [Candidatus Limnocylindrales bacterium]|jgi:hypothetical protein